MKKRLQITVEARTSYDSMQAMKAVASQLTMKWKDEDIGADTTGIDEHADIQVVQEDVVEGSNKGSSFEDCVNVIRDVMNNTHSMRKQSAGYSAILQLDSTQVEGDTLKQSIKRDKDRVEEQERQEWNRIRPALKKLLKDNNE